MNMKILVKRFNEYYLSVAKEINNLSEEQTTPLSLFIKEHPQPNLSCISRIKELGSTSIEKLLDDADYPQDIKTALLTLIVLSTYMLVSNEFSPLLYDETLISIRRELNELQTRKQLFTFYQKYVHSEIDESGSVSKAIARIKGTELNEFISLNQNLYHARDAHKNEVSILDLILSHDIPALVGIQSSVFMLNCFNKGNHSEVQDNPLCLIGTLISNNFYVNLKYLAELEYLRAALQTYRDIEAIEKEVLTTYLTKYICTVKELLYNNLQAFLSKRNLI